MMYVLFFAAVLIVSPVFLLLTAWIMWLFRSPAYDEHKRAHPEKYWF